MMNQGFRKEDGSLAGLRSQGVDEIIASLVLYIFILVTLGCYGLPSLQIESGQNP